MLTASACRHTLAIFDGSHRFDIALSFKRMDRVDTEAGYRGPAVVCAMSYRPVAGYTPGTFRVDYLRKSRGMEMWLAPVAGTRVPGGDPHRDLDHDGNGGAQRDALRRGGPLDVVCVRHEALTESRIVALFSRSTGAMQTGGCLVDRL